MDIQTPHMLTNIGKAATRFTIGRVPVRIPLLAVAITLLAGLAEATTLARLGLAELTNNAVCIFVGTCEQVEVLSMDTRIYTRYQFSVSEIVKGTDPGQTLIEVCLPGGELEGRIQHVSGMPSFTPGAETVLFLTGHNGSGHAWPVGLSQGAFAIHGDRGQGDARVYRRLSGINLLNMDVGTRAAKNTVPAAAALDPLDGGMALEVFLSQVRTILNPSHGSAREFGESAR